MGPAAERKGGRIPPKSWLGTLAWAGALLAGVILAVQVFYYAAVYRSFSAQPPGPFDLVLKYTDSGSLRFALDLAVRFHRPLFISKTDWDPVPFHGRLPPGHPPVYVDDRGKTTDSNARFSAPFIRSHGFKRVLLVTAWYHEPRSLFLTRLYLLGSGVSVAVFPSEPLPPDWWRRRVFWVELGKFWGSLGRAFLAAGGWETGPDKADEGWNGE